MISTKGRYALRVMIDIGRHQNAAPVSVKDISSRQDISVKYLEQVVSILSKAGLIRSFRGNAGGYKLNVDPENARRETFSESARVRCRPLPVYRTKTTIASAAHTVKRLIFGAAFTMLSTNMPTASLFRI